jgi:hypothetical protein
MTVNGDEPTGTAPLRGSCLAEQSNCPPPGQPNPVSGDGGDENNNTGDNNQTGGGTGTAISYSIVEDLANEATNRILNGKFSEVCETAIGLIKTPQLAASMKSLKQAAANVTHFDGSTSDDVRTSGQTYAQFFAANPDYSAQAPIGPFKAFDGQARIYWNPNSTAASQVFTSGAMVGIVMHELLHNIGFSDSELQDKLMLDVDPKDTHNISRWLSLICF